MKKTSLFLLALLLCFSAARSQTPIVGFGTSDSFKVTSSGGTASLAGFTIIPPPTITSFSPTSGAVGSTVTITGTNFNTTPANNSVFFGATKATVASATSTSLNVIVPNGATYKPISVTDLITGLTAYSIRSFITTFTGSNAFDQNSFAAKVNFTTGARPNNILSSDFDGDGKPDLVAVNQYSNSISIYRNTSLNSTVSFDPKVDYTTADYPSSVDIADLDGDGKLDLAVTNSAAKSVSIFRNTSTNGVISFASKVNFPTGIWPSSISMGDFDCDGKVDIAISNSNAVSVSILHNTSTIGTISFASKVDFTITLGPYNVSVADFDSDGKPDLAVACIGSGSSDVISVLRNTSTLGSISFAACVDYVVTGASGPSKASDGDIVGDIDSDGKIDLIGVNYSGNKISVYRNTSSVGAISFAANTDFAVGNYPDRLSIGDLDGDGKPDITASSTDLSLLRNTSTMGSISFATNVSNTAVRNPYGSLIDDLDGDGKSDLIIIDVLNNEISVLRNIEKPVLTVTFNTQGGSVIADVTANYNSLITAPTTPTRAGYSFAGWYKEAACTNIWNFTSDKVTTAITLYAKWTITTSYTVTFNSLGGSLVSSVIANYNSLIMAPSSPTRTGCSFAGWYKEAACTNMWNFTSDKVTATSTLYAKWAINTPGIQERNVEVPKISGTIVLDGVEDDFYASIPANDIKIEVDSADGDITIPSAYWKAAWSNDGIYVVVVVEDDDHFPSWEAGASTSWAYDKPEIYFDVNETLTDELGAAMGPFTGHSQFAPAFGDGLDGIEQTDGDRLYAHKVTGQNYIFEYFVPFTYLEQAADGFDASRPIGFDVTVIDRDEYSNNFRLRKTWSNNNSFGESWSNMDGCGTITLTDAGTVKFNTLGGSLVSSITADYNSLIKAPTAPTRTGYSFAGWYKEAAYTNIWNFSSDKVTTAITLYAKWNINTYTVSFNTQGGSSVNSITAKYNSLISAPSAPTRTGYSFAGWCKEATCTNAWRFTSDKVTTATILYAKWNINTYTVSFAAQGGSSVPNVTANYNSLITAPIAPILKGFTFAGWYKEAACTNSWNFTADKVTAAITLYAKWAVSSYIVSFSTNGGTAVGNIYLKSNSIITSPANPSRKGFTFSAWYRDVELTNAWNFETDTVKENTVLFAKWNINNYKVTFKSNGGNSIPSIYYNYNSIITEPEAPSKLDYSFDGWYKDYTLENKWNFETDRLVNTTYLYAKWNNARFNVTYNTNGGSKIGSVQINNNSLITAPAIPFKEGFSFSGWFKDTTCINEWEFDTDRVSSDTTLYANWTKEITQIYASKSSILTLYPSHATTDVNIKGCNMQKINVYNLLGIKVMQIEMNGKDNTKLNVSKLKSGHYLVHVITSDARMVTLKMFKE